ncbi:Uncharacterised protein [Klebsiella pneumoniae]|nr:Uncharacterised protein [Klebsiella pneumoniae]SSG84735.1 Uncharacterised protein [Klebsiella pneumoniae]
MEMNDRIRLFFIHMAALYYAEIVSNRSVKYISVERGYSNPFFNAGKAKKWFRCSSVKERMNKRLTLFKAVFIFQPFIEKCSLSRETIW